MTSKRLRTARLSLEPIEMNDLAWFTALNRHPRVRRHLWDGRSIESAEARDIIVRSAEAFAREGHGLWVGRAREAAVGYYGLWYFFGEPQPQLLYVSDPRLTRRGYAREACRSIIAHAFGELGLSYLDAAVDAGNAPSLALARALGFTERRTESVDARPTILLRRERLPAASRSG